jgi:hypothetical protein
MASVRWAAWRRISDDSSEVETTEVETTDVETTEVETTTTERARAVPL